MSGPSRSPCGCLGQSSERLGGALRHRQGSLVLAGGEDVSGRLHRHCVQRGSRCHEQCSAVHAAELDVGRLFRSRKSSVTAARTFRVSSTPDPFGLFPGSLRRRIRQPSRRPASVWTGVRSMSTGNSLPSRRLPNRAWPAPTGRAEAVAKKLARWPGCLARNRSGTRARPRPRFSLRCRVYCTKVNQTCAGSAPPGTAHQQRALKSWPCRPIGFPADREATTGKGDCRQDRLPSTLREYHE